MKVIFETHLKKILLKKNSFSDNCLFDVSATQVTFSYRVIKNCDSYICSTFPESHRSKQKHEIFQLFKSRSFFGASNATARVRTVYSIFIFGLPRPGYGVIEWRLGS